VKGLPFVESPLQVLGRSYNQIERKRSIQFDVDLRCFAEFAPRRQDNQQIDIAIRVRFSVSIRPKQDDLVRLEVLGDLTCVLRIADIGT